MSKFSTAMSSYNTTTSNGAVSHSNPDPNGKYSGRIGLFFKGVRGLSIPRLYQFLKDASCEDINDTFILAFHLRDCRGGKGERELGRQSLIWLFLAYPEKFMKIVTLLPEYGRWDDILEFFPVVLNLNDIKYIRSNFNVNIPNKNVEYLRKCQQEIVKLTATCLIQDHQNMSEGKPCSLLAKWLPTEKGSLDCCYNVVNTICNTMNITPKEYRKKYLSPLRAYLNIVERYMCTNKWDEINFSNVPSCAMKKLKNAFERNAPDNFQAWKSQLVKEDSSVSVKAKQLFPHELVKECIDNKADVITEEQWKVIEKEVESYGKLEGSLVMCDVSGSMYCGNPIYVSIAMGVLVSHATKGPFHNHVMSFSSDPSFFVLRDGSLQNRVSQIEKDASGLSTDFIKAHRMIVDQAKRFNLVQEDMPHTLFVISDMSFDESFGKTTNYEEVCQYYTNNGYDMPRIVFWNVNGSTHDFPVTIDDHGTLMISGFSPSILKSVIETGDFTSCGILRTILNGDRYAPIRDALLAD